MNLEKKLLGLLLVIASLLGSTSPKPASASGARNIRYAATESDEDGEAALFFSRYVSSPDEENHLRFDSQGCMERIQGQFREDAEKEKRMEEACTMMAANVGFMNQAVDEHVGSYTTDGSFEADPEAIDEKLQDSVQSAEQEEAYKDTEAKTSGQSHSLDQSAFVKSWHWSLFRGFDIEFGATGTLVMGIIGAALNCVSSVSTSLIKAFETTKTPYFELVQGLLGNPTEQDVMAKEVLNELVESLGVETSLSTMNQVALSLFQEDYAKFGTELVSFLVTAILTFEGVSAILKATETTMVGKIVAIILTWLSLYFPGAIERRTDDLSRTEEPFLYAGKDRMAIQRL